MQSYNYCDAVAALTGQSIAALFGGAAPLVRISESAGGPTIVKWDASLGAEPTMAQLLAAATAPPTQAQLQAYAAAKRGAIAAGGVSVNVAAAGAAPLMLEAATDAGGLVDLAGLLQASSLMPEGPFAWQQGATSVPLTQAQVQTLAVGVYAFVQLTWTAQAGVLAAIAAGTITTTAQIDDPTTVGLEAWPVNS